MKPIVYLIIALGLPNALRAQDDIPLLLPEERQAVDAQADEFNEAIKPAIATAAKSTVRVWSGSRRLAYGTVVGDGRKILTKWSEVARARVDLRVDAGDESRAVKLAGVYQDEDLVLLEIEGKPLTPVSWSFEAPKLGGFLAAPQPDGRLAAFGVVSVLSRNLRDTDLAYLGVIGEPGFTGQGVKIKEVDAKSGAHAAGLKPGNVILKVGERPISGLLELKNALTGVAPGAKVSLLVEANGGENKIEVTVGNRPQLPQYANGRLEQMERMGGPVSQVRDSFTQVIQTDMRPKPNQVGGPVVDLQGRVLGITMARGLLRRLSGRTHRVCTGVCVIYPGGGKNVFHDTTEVTFLTLDDAAIEEYFALVNPLDKAGAYGIQESGERIIAGIRGNFDNVMGLPVAKVIAALG